MDIPDAVHEVAQWQEHVVSRQQLLLAGVSYQIIRHRLTRGRWQQLYRGVYALFTGIPTREQLLWAAVLRAGSGAALSYWTAAELHGMTTPAEAIHVTIPATRRINVRGNVIHSTHPHVPPIVVHVSQRIAVAVQPARTPARTTIEETALDLTQTSRALDDVAGWVTRALNTRKTTTEKLRETLITRKKVGWRIALTDILAATALGVRSPLEYRYFKKVERAHGLPLGARQVKVVIDGKSNYRDVYYEEYRLVVELDGAQAHPAIKQASDWHRDVVTSAEGIETVRYGWAAVAGQPCRTAILQARILQRHGWGGTPKPCGPGCPVRAAFPRAA